MVRLENSPLIRKMTISAIRADSKIREMQKTSQEENTFFSKFFGPPQLRSPKPLPTLIMPVQKKSVFDKIFDSLEEVAGKITERFTKHETG